jgi:DNA-binding winged helix-turn-helix (wHTH) protein/tetratricopeptide (TPR) repeat protein
MATQSKSSTRLAFGPFEVNAAGDELLKGGARTRLRGQPLQILLVLLEHSGEVVTREQLREHIWPDGTFVDFEHGLNAAMNKLRRTLGDSAENPRYIETVPTAGYRFVARVTLVEVNSAVRPTTQTGPPPALEKPRGGSRKWILASAILLVGIGVATFLYSRHDKKVLTEKDTVVLADFDNSTGNPVFDGALRQGMSVQLEQSPFLSLIDDQRIQQTLKLMGQPPDARLTPAIAREVCERTASAAVLDGSIASLGTQYVLGLRATDCRTGKVLAEEQVQATRKEDVLNALSQIASSFRTRVGESLATVEKYDTPLVDATTPSLEALKAYSLGRKRHATGGNIASQPYFRRAIELDPNFAMAYAYLSTTYTNRREPELAAENIRKAYELRAKVSERERFYIESHYYWSGTGELEKAGSVLEQWQQTYPGYYSPYATSGVIYNSLGNSEKALEEAREAMRLEPNSARSYNNLATDYINLNRLDEAEAVFTLADERKLEDDGPPSSRYRLAFLKGDTARMAQLASATMGKPGEEDLMLAAQADTEAWYGRLKDARELTRRAMDSAEHNDAQETAAGYQAAAAMFEADLGNREQARADDDAAMKLSPNRNVQVMTALALARAGDTAAAEKLATELDKAFPLDTLVQRYWLPSIRAAVALQRKDPNRAIELLRTASDIELGDPRLLPVFLRGEAYLMLHDGTRAAAEFQKFIDHHGLVRNQPWGALARLGLARAYTTQGNTTKARAAYQDFLTLWKDADPDLPILQQAKEESAKLQ